MRTIGRLMLAALAVLTMPSLAQAQEGRLFKNAWFWGAKVGSMYYTTPTHTGYAPVLGGEWIITRTRGALYLAVQESFMPDDEPVGSIEDPYSSTGRKPVWISDMRQVTIAGLIFPTQKRGYLRPYAGLGFTLANAFSSGAALNGFESETEKRYLEAAVEDAKSAASLIGMVGLQAQYRRLSAFGQAAMMPAHGTSFLLNGNYTLYFEGGLRYNIGTSIDRPY